MEKLMKKGILTIAALLFCTPAFSHDQYECERLSLDTTNWKDRASAEYWFPEKLIIVVADDQKWMASYYGVDSKRSENERKFNIGNFDINGGISVSIRATKLTKSAGGRAIASLSYRGGFLDPKPTAYDCASAQNTNWEPKEEN